MKRALVGLLLLAITTRVPQGTDMARYTWSDIAGNPSMLQWGPNGRLINGQPAMYHDLGDSGESYWETDSGQSYPAPQDTTSFLDKLIQGAAMSFPALAAGGVAGIGPFAGDVAAAATPGGNGLSFAEYGGTDVPLGANTPSWAAPYYQTNTFNPNFLSTLGGTAAGGAAGSAIGKAAGTAAGAAAAGSLIPGISNALLGAGLGAALGGLSGGNKPAGQVTSVQDIPDWLKPYVVGNLTDAAGKMGQASSAESLLPQAQDQLSRTINGDYLNPESNPALKPYAQDLMGLAGSNFLGTFGGPAGSNINNSGVQEGYTRAITNAVLPLYNSAYNTERGNQVNAAGSAPAFAGQASQAVFGPNTQFSSLIPGLRTQSQPYFSNTFGNLASGALGGYALGKAFGQ